MIYVFIGCPHHLTIFGTLIHFIDKRQIQPLWIMRWRRSNKIAFINPTAYPKLQKLYSGSLKDQMPFTGKF
jgi:hypothetical protein